MLKITQLRHIDLLTPDPTALAHFYSQSWGLGLVGEIEGAYYLRSTASNYYQLGLHQGEQRAIQRLTFGLADRVAVDAAAVELAGRGVAMVSPPHALSGPDGGYGFQLVDPDGRCVELVSDAADAPPLEWATPVKPTKISHVVLNTPDIERATTFYTNVLGFRISDWSEDQMVFLRCSPDHHSISFNRAAHSSLNHIAWEVPGVDEVMRGIANARKPGGAAIIWGPGRHGPGHNIFCYFHDAAGFVCEYTAEVQQIEDEAAHVAQVWSRKIPEKMDLWGIAGPPSPEARAAMAGTPDPGWLTVATR